MLKSNLQYYINNICTYSFNGVPANNLSGLASQNEQIATTRVQRCVLYFAIFCTKGIISLIFVRDKTAEP